MAMKPWRYHVALVFRDTDGQIMVLDPVGSSGHNRSPSRSGRARSSDRRARFSRSSRPRSAADYIYSSLI
jgi:hypothetical protein